MTHKQTEKTIGSKACRLLTVLALGALLIGGGVRADEDCPVSENLRGHENTEWSRGYAYHLTDAKKGLPRVLLVGDSICCGYEGNVRRHLEGKVNVSYWASSYCVTSPNYLKLLAFYLDESEYAVIHFNNGLHSLKTPDDDWEKGFAAALDLIQKKQPKAKLVWCSSTPLADAALTEKVKKLNERGRKVAEKRGIPENDLFSLLDPLDRKENWTDKYHHKPPVREKAGRQIAETILKYQQNRGDER